MVDPASSAAQSTRACGVLGVKEIEFEPVKCCELFYSKQVMQRVEKVIYDYGIETAFIHFDSDMNQDHVEASRICMTALRHCKNILMYQSNGYILEHDYYPRFFVDISDTFEKKKQALRCYGSEHNRSNRLFETVCTRNEIWGYGCEVEAAEGFRIVKMLY